MHPPKGPIRTQMELVDQEGSFTLVSFVTVEVVAFTLHCTPINPPSHFSSQAKMFAQHDNWQILNQICTVKLVSSFWCYWICCEPTNGIHRVATNFTASRPKSSMSDQIQAARTVHGKKWKLKMLVGPWSLTIGISFEKFLNFVNIIIVQENETPETKAPVIRCQNWF